LPQVEKAEYLLMERLGHEALLKLTEELVLVF